jgi:hypothetical protein
MNEVSTPYSIAEVAALMHLSPRVVTQLFEKEPGVIIYEVKNPRRKLGELPECPHLPARLREGHPTLQSELITQESPDFVLIRATDSRLPTF